MSNIIPFQEFGLIDKKGFPMVGSRAVADRFHKRHDDVLKTIRNLDCSGNFRLRNFADSSYKNEQNKKQPEVLMTRDGFTFLAMGFTGKKAAEWKEKYIAAFNAMESYIRDQTAARLEYRPMTDAIQSAHDPAKFYHYTTENDMLYRLVLGMSSKKFREKNGLGENATPKSFMTAAQMDLFLRLQRSNTELITLGWDYEKRKAHLALLADKIKTPVLRLAQ